MQEGETVREVDRAGLVVPAVGSLVATGQVWEPYRLLDPGGASVACVGEFFAELQGRGSAAATVRSYGMDLLRWFRFLWTLDVLWDRATRAEARDFARWMRVTDKPVRPHWRTGVVPGGSPTGRAYSASARAHSETVLRGFYEFHREQGTGPLLNPFPLARHRRGGRIGAHTNPMDAPVDQRRGLYRPVVPSRIPRSVPDAEFNAIFARLPSHRDRALVAFYVSTGVRASELLSVTTDRVDPGRQVITVVRKGSGALAQVPASSDAFVWLRLYQVELGRSVPTGRGQPLWWTLRSPARPLTYPAVHRMFERVCARAGSGATLHSLRHTAAYRMAEDPGLPLTDVQFVLGHAQLSTTQLYLTPRQEQVIARVLAHHAAQTAQAAARVVPPPAPGYRPETLDVLFGGGTR